MRHILGIEDLDADELERASGGGTVDGRAEGPDEGEDESLPPAPLLPLLFQRPSLRTRVSYEAAALQLGGRCVALAASDWEGRPPEEVARSLSPMAAALVVRARSHNALQALAEHASVPVINALSDREHPVEVLADARLLRERWGALGGRTLSYVGCATNVCHSLLLLAPRLGMHLMLATPPGHEPLPSIVAQAERAAARRGTRLETGLDPGKAIARADALYTDTWPSCASPEEAEERRERWAPYRLDTRTLERARPKAVVLHCLPANRDEEISGELLEHPRCLAYERLRHLVPVTVAVLRSALGRTPHRDPSVVTSNEEGAGT